MHSRPRRSPRGRSPCSSTRPPRGSRRRSKTSRIARVLGLPLDADALVAVLAGHAVPPKDLRVAELVPDDRLGPSLTLVGADRRQRVWMDFETGAVRQLEIDGGPFPVTITFRRDG